MVRALHQAAERGTSYGAPTEGEVILAGMICEAFPAIDLVRLVSSGTEAAMSAIRVGPRLYQARPHSEIRRLLSRSQRWTPGAAGSGATTLGIPNSGGVPSSYTQQTLSLPFNNLAAVADFRQISGRIAAVVEPIPGNMGVVLPASGFLQGLRELTSQDGALLVFDEVITGFRVLYGGAQHLGVTPDLTILGKIIGGGLPVGAFGGRRDIMEQIAPLGPVYQAGTLSGIRWR